MKQKIHSLQVLRCIGFLLIFFSHLGNGFPTQWGGLGVSLFVILSGYVITISFNVEDKTNISPLKYAFKRVKKVFPLHIILMLISIAGDLAKGTLTTDPFVLLLNALMVKAFVPNKSIYFSMNGVTWYLTLVWFFALMTPALLKLLTKIVSKRACLQTFFIILLFRFIWIVACQRSQIAQWLTYINPLFRLTDYYLGMLLGVLTASKREMLTGKKFKLIKPIIWSVFIIYVVMCYFNMPYYTVFLRTPISVGLIILFSITEMHNKYERILVYENKFFQFVGDISFELFLTHMLGISIGNRVYNMLGLESVFLRVCLCLGISIVGSYIYMHIEKKIRESIKALEKKVA